MEKRNGGDSERHLVWGNNDLGESNLRNSLLQN